MLPVPLNSSTMTSSILEPVSTSAEAMIVSEPPSSMLRAAPKNFLGGYSAPESTPPDMMRRGGQVVGARQTGDAVEDDPDVATLLDETLRALDAQFGDVRVLFSRTVE